MICLTSLSDCRSPPCPANGGAGTDAHTSARQTLVAQVWCRVQGVEEPIVLCGCLALAVMKPGRFKIDATGLEAA